jgi:hypothetical protein
VIPDTSMAAQSRAGTTPRTSATAVSDRGRTDGRSDSDTARGYPPKTVGNVGGRVPVGGIPRT